MEENKGLRRGLGYCEVMRCRVPGVGLKGVPEIEEEGRMACRELVREME